MGKKATKALATCPDCGADIRFRKAPHLGQMVTCTRCETTLEVVSRTPLQLDWAFADPFAEEYDGDYKYEDIDDEDKYFEEDEGAYDYDNDDWDN